MCVHMHLHVCAHEHLCVLFQCPAEVLMVTILAGSALRVGTGAQVGDCGNTGHPLRNRLEGQFLFWGAAFKWARVVFVFLFPHRIRAGFWVGTRLVCVTGFGGRTLASSEIQRIHGIASTLILHIHPFIFSCSFQQDLCLIKLLSFIIIKEKCGGRALQTPLNENQIVEPAGKQGLPCVPGAQWRTSLQGDRLVLKGTCPPGTAWMTQGQGQSDLLTCQLRPCWC